MRGGGEVCEEVGKEEGKTVLTVVQVGCGL